MYSLYNIFTMDFFKLAQKERSIKKNKSLTICANYLQLASQRVKFFFLVFLLLTILIDEKIHI